MLFNSYVFILLFLPATVAGFYLAGRLLGREGAIGWLVLASLLFYGWWEPIYLVLILGSIVFNYSLGLSIIRQPARGRAAYWLTAAGITVNLGALAYFKYAVFFVSNVNAIGQWDIGVPEIVLPLAISFFTFQQISYLADTYAGKASEYNFLHYCLFVTFFPQLIAGPIVHHGEMLPQFARRDLLQFNHENLAVGTTLFFMGLFKKVVLADGIAVYATPVFETAEAGHSLTLIEAWGGVAAYTFQIYFDFSGYSDMALGLARMFGIVLPLNFDSPYKAENIIDFWRRWHMTLSRFLRDYIYIPLGGNRKGPRRRHVNLMTVMLLGGLWHGAGWTFVIWGGLHGLYLVLNHGWNAVKLRVASEQVFESRWWRFGARSVTLLAVMVAWVFFRAESTDGAVRVLQGMAGLNGISIPEMHRATLNGLFGLGDMLAAGGVAFAPTQHFLGFGPMLHLFGLLLICWYLPNTQDLLRDFRPALDFSSAAGRFWPRWRFSPVHAVLLAGTGLYTMSLMTNISEFLYFQF